MRYLYQLVLCSSRVGRVFRREIAISEVNAMVTSTEIMPPGYHIALAKMRRENEAVFQLRHPLKVGSDYKGCPFCNSMNIFTCKCGAISCITADPVTHHECPNCKKIFGVKTVKEFFVSESGFIGGNRLLQEQRKKKEISSRPSSDSGEGAEIQRLLREMPGGKPKQLKSGWTPGLPEPDGPKYLPPHKNKALPPPKQKALPPAGNSDGKSKEESRGNLQDFLKKRKKK